MLAALEADSCRGAGKGAPKRPAGPGEQSRADPGQRVCVAGGGGRGRCSRSREAEAAGTTPGCVLRHGEAGLPLDFWKEKFFLDWIQLNLN
ncbi:hypothetical protein Y1Q_0001461 [Alligator mississippiensis]|uniref:Uncharacterized protein n=1 Tax=Alligator mississippiensis TaxID=8496 RepID=A0A151M9J1_ALLMI|nr:hypothetical protein Y1Q_0001461 [Alligator mississippiensis]